MISFHQCTDLFSIGDLKGEYLRSLSAPVDDMWESRADSSPHWEMRLGGEPAGYYAANDEGSLLQFHVSPAFENHRRALFDHVIAQDGVTQAMVSTIDPSYLSLCLDAQKEVTVHTYMYEIDPEARPLHPRSEDLTFRQLEGPELDRTVLFQDACLESEVDLSQWLRDYSANLLEREGLFVLCRDDEWFGLGEYRCSRSQEGVVDLGMMVAPAHRREGWATDILTRLVARGTAEGRRVICSTEVGNVGAQEAIIRSGFHSRHRILHVSF